MLPIFTTNQVKDGVDSGDLLIDLTEYMKKKDGATKTELESLVSVVAGKLDAEPQHKHHIDDIKQLETALASKYDTSEKYSYNVILSDSEKIPYLEAPKIEVMELVKDKESAGYKFYVDEGSGDLMIVNEDILVASYTKATNTWSFSGLNLGEINELTARLNELSTEAATVHANHYEALNAVCNATLINITDINTLKSSLQNTHAIVTDNSIDIASNTAKITGLQAVVNEYIAKTDAVLKNHYDALLLLCQKHGMVDGDGDAGDKISPE